MDLCTNSELNDAPSHTTHTHTFLPDKRTLFCQAVKGVHFWMLVTGESWITQTFWLITVLLWFLKNPNQKLMYEVGCSSYCKVWFFYVQVTIINIRRSQCSSTQCNLMPAYILHALQCKPIIEKHISCCKSGVYLSGILHFHSML